MDSIASLDGWIDIDWYHRPAAALKGEGHDHTRDIQESQHGGAPHPRAMGEDEDEGHRILANPYAAPELIEWAVEVLPTEIGSYQWQNSQG